VMIKIPATLEGLRAIEDTVAAGINVNVTLIFSLDRHRAVIDAYLAGLARLDAAGGDLAQVSSVASFFVSRVDTETDRRLPEGHALRGKAAVANAKLAYALFRQRFSGPKWEALAAKGARLQRPLWASTSTKNPAYPPTLYIDELVGRDTVNTLAPAGLAEAGVDFHDVTAVLEREGVDAFAASFRDALATIEKRRAEVSG